MDHRHPVRAALLLIGCIGYINSAPAREVRPPQPVCLAPKYPPVVQDKAEAYQYLKGDKGQIYNYREATYEFRKDWFNIDKYPELRLTERQRVWWNSLEKLRAKVYPQDIDTEEKPTRSKRQITPLCERKEYRQLSTSQRNILHAAFNDLHTSIPDPLGDPSTSEYDIFVMLHRSVNSPGAHSGPGFLVWHREFLLMMETALRIHQPTVCLPYFDSTLDQPLPDASDSAIWSSGYLGNNNGVVSSGFAAGWSVIPTCTIGGSSNLQRNTMTGSSGSAALFSDLDIDWVLNQNSYDDITCPNNCKFEYDHGSVHVFVGGQMGSTACSPSDPVFWMHHAFVDCTWERFREQSPYPGPQPPTMDYGTGGGAAHNLMSPMQPFAGVINAQGLGNHYTDYYYTCAAPPSMCNPTTSNPCSSSALYCDVSSCMCRAKVRQGGDCTGLTNHACAGPCFSWLMVPYCNTVTNTCACKHMVATALPHELSKF